jgi:hypothetical protein
VQIWEHWTKGTILEIADPSLANNNIPEDKIRAYIHIGLMCVQESPADRPAMSAVNVILNRDAASLQTPSKPAFCLRAGSADQEPLQVASDGGGMPAAVSANHASVTELVPR